MLPSLPHFTGRIQFTRLCHRPVHFYKKCENSPRTKSAATSSPRPKCCRTAYNISQSFVLTGKTVGALILIYCVLFCTPQNHLFLNSYPVLKIPFQFSVITFSSVFAQPYTQTRSLSLSHTPTHPQSLAQTHTAL